MRSMPKIVAPPGKPTVRSRGPSHGRWRNGEPDSSRWVKHCFFHDFFARQRVSPRIQRGDRSTGELTEASTLTSSSKTATLGSRAQPSIGRPLHFPTRASMDVFSLNQMSGQVSLTSAGSSRGATAETMAHSSAPCGHETWPTKASGQLRAHLAWANPACSLPLDDSRERSGAISGRRSG
jgi:hypothetical protein